MFRVTRCFGFWIMCSHPTELFPLSAYAHLLGSACFRPVVDLVLENDRVNPVPALHTAQGW